MRTSKPNHPIEEIAASDALLIAPFMRAERVDRAVLEKGVSDIDVATLLQSYLKGFNIAVANWSLTNP